MRIEWTFPNGSKRGPEVDFGIETTASFLKLTEPYHNRHKRPLVC
jgi:hypothetical protein